MATIGLDMLHYAKITEDAEGNESYGTPQKLAKAMSADLSVELAEATLYADDGAAEIVKEFKSGTLSLGVDDIGATVASDLTGATIDKNGVVISTGEDGGGSRCDRLPCQKEQRQIQILLAVQGEVRHPRDRTCDQGRQHHLQHSHHRRHHPSQNTSWTVRISILGKRRSPKAKPVCLPLLSPIGIQRYTNRLIRQRQRIQNNIWRYLWIKNAAPTSSSAARNTHSR